MDLQLANKVIMVAGASKGLGFAIADTLTNEGALLSLASRDEKRMQQAASVLSPSPRIAQSCDVTNNHDIEKWVANTITKCGRIDGLVINAGGPKPGQFNDFNDADWLEAFHLTLLSAVRLVRCVLPYMRQQQQGSIVVLTSSSVKEPIEGLLLSNVMRSGVTSLAKSLSLAEAQHGIRVNCLVPGVIATDRIDQLDYLQSTKQHISINEQRTQRSANIPMGRYGKPNEFANAAAFLLSNAASYMTGSTVVVDGGAMRSL